MSEPAGQVVAKNSLILVWTYVNPRRGDDLLRWEFNNRINQKIKIYTNTVTSTAESTPKLTPSKLSTSTVPDIKPRLSDQPSSSYCGGQKDEADRTWVLWNGYRSCKSGERKLRNEEKTNNGFHDQLVGCSARNTWEGRKSRRAMPGTRMLYRDFIRRANGSSPISSIV